MNDQTTDNERARMGGNNPPLPALISEAAERDDFAKLVTEWLGERFGFAPQETTDLLNECTALVKNADGSLKPIEDDATKAKVASLIKRIRDAVKKFDGMHDKEKTAYHRGGQAVDQYFFALIDRLARRDKKNKPGAADVLQGLLTDYDTKVLAAENARRAAAAAEAARIAREAQLKAEQEERDRLEAEAAAARARNPEKIEEKKEVAQEKTVTAAVATAEASRAQAVADEKRIETFAKPADIMRSRGDDGTLTTMATEPYAEIIPGQDGLLDKEALWPYIKLEAKEQALRAYAKNTGYTVQMNGATIGRRPKSVVR